MRNYLPNDPEPSPTCPGSERDTDGLQLMGGAAARSSGSAAT
jgi:hypothetical protein